MTANIDLIDGGSRGFKDPLLRAGLDICGTGSSGKESGSGIRDGLKR
jgi:hypothetical protein